MKLFSFENLGGEYEKLGKEIKSGSKVSVYGLSAAQKFLIASLPTRPVLYLTSDALTAQHAADAIFALSGKKPALLCAKDEVLTFRKALSRDALFRRLTALYEWECGASVMVADIEAAIQLCPKRVGRVKLEVGKETSLSGLVNTLAELGYTREYEPESKGTFAVRGDILDIYPVNCEHPARIDFFGDEVEAIKPYDEVTSDRLERVDSLVILAATDALWTEEDRGEIEKVFQKELKKAKTSESFSRMSAISEAVLSGEGRDFVLPLLESSCDLFSLLPENCAILFDECKLIHDRLDGLYREHEERYLQLLEGGEVMTFSRDQYVEREDFLSNIPLFCNVALQTFMGSTFFFDPLSMHNIPSTPVRRYLNSISELVSDLKTWQQTGYSVFLWCGDEARAGKVGEELRENGLFPTPFSGNLENFHGIALLPKTLESGFLLHESKIAVIGTGDLFLKTSKDRRIRKKRGDLFLAPEVGDFAVHESYGVGKITGTKKI